MPALQLIRRSTSNGIVTLDLHISLQNQTALKVYVAACQMDILLDIKAAAREHDIQSRGLLKSVLPYCDDTQMLLCLHLDPLLTVCIITAEHGFIFPFKAVNPCAAEATACS